MHELVAYGKLQFASVIKVLLVRSFLLPIPLALDKECGCDLGGFEVSRRVGRGVIYLTPLSTSKLCPVGVGDTLGCVRESVDVWKRSIMCRTDVSDLKWMGPPTSE
jgi:hypothetical protein